MNESNQNLNASKQKLNALLNRYRLITWIVAGSVDLAILTAIIYYFTR